MKNILASLVCLVALAACGGGNDGPPPMTSASERAVVAQVRGVNLRIQYDTAMTEGVVFVTYAEPVPGMANWLSISRDVIPTVEQVTGCRYRGAPVPENQILGDIGVGNVPVSC
ncbi:hypothetical protein SLH49_06050 [Cognatiyoonia sp. IB215446]|uniref:hypothetical protein n=1 Tax=Cognatiyoonia sp. IB215446 TaxID=3097355 RepID=UPI002A0E2AD9|nr:hypothetical protein [Cognatiyoonia sp. IB215446]MDX8347545.1 hypothetical protein [Cognatiyoonia sp. IB215446]